MAFGAAVSRNFGQESFSITKYNLLLNCIHSIISESCFVNPYAKQKATNLRFLSFSDRIRPLATIHLKETYYEESLLFLRVHQVGHRYPDLSARYT